MHQHKTGQAYESLKRYSSNLGQPTYDRIASMREREREKYYTYPALRLKYEVPCCVWWPPRAPPAHVTAQPRTSEPLTDLTAPDSISASPPTLLCDTVAPFAPTSVL